MALVKLDINRTMPYADGQVFGETGPYLLLEGTAHFAVDPLSAVNTEVTDIDLAPRDSEGQVRFSSRFAMLQPADPDKGNRSVFFDVVNRGGRTAFKTFNSGDPQPEPARPLDPGNGFLLRHGYTVVWCGWQPDLPSTAGLIGMKGPQAIGPDGPLEGRILCWYQELQLTQVLKLSHMDHQPHPPVHPDDPSAILYVSDHPNGPIEPVSRDRWSFVRVEDEQNEPEPSHVFMPSGFEPGRIYQLVYKTRGSTIVGLGFTAVRDTVSFLKYAPSKAGNPCAGYIDYAHAFGRSQCGRFLRQYIHLGLNEDEKGRMALDGIISHTGGGNRGEFNLRFGQPSKDICFLSPELFPFTDTEQADPVTGVTGSILARLEKRGKVPKVMFINTSAEYWRGDAALIHTDLESMSDAPQSESVRRYHLAGTMHGSGVFPPNVTRPSDGVRGQLPFNSVDYNPLHRAAIQNLDAWVRNGTPPPPSRHPSLDIGTAVESESLAPRFGKLPGVSPPTKVTKAMRLDYGPEAHLGRTTTLPARRGEPYPALVSDVDADFNEVAGIRLPDLTVPVATYTGWNLRHPENGNPDLYMGVSGGLSGSTLPFPARRADREATSDPRLSIEERYDSREDYLRQVDEAARSLLEEGYLLAEDLEEVLEKAARRYDHFLGNGTS